MRTPNQPLISVIIPIYNTGQVVLPLLKKLSNDPYKNLEIICVDDGSTDETEKLLSDFVKNSKSKKIILKRQENAGPSAARNTGINISSGEYLIFIDSDDEVEEKFISKLAKALDDKRVDLAVTGIYYHQVMTGQRHQESVKSAPKQGKNETKPAYILKLLAFDGRLYAVHNKIYRAGIVKKFGLSFDEKLRFAEDLKFNLEYIKYSSGDIKFIKEALYIYNYGTPTSLVQKTALSAKNWRTSYAHLKSWVKSQQKGKLTPLREVLLMWKVKVRWHISHAGNVLRACPTLISKIKRASIFWLLVAKLAFRLRNARRRG